MNFQALMSRQITIEKNFCQIFFGISIKNCPGAQKKFDVDMTHLNMKKV